MKKTVSPQTLTQELNLLQHHIYKKVNEINAISEMYMLAAVCGGLVVPSVSVVVSSVGLVVPSFGSEVVSSVAVVVLVALSIIWPVMQFLPKIFAW